MAFRTPVDYVNKVPRSTHNQSLDVRTTLHPCLLIPIYHDTLDMGEIRKLDLSSLLQAEPFLAPYMGGFTLRLEVYFDPLRNYYSWIDNNDKRSTEDILDAKKHRFAFPCTSSGVFQGYSVFLPLQNDTIVTRDMSVLRGAAYTCYPLDTKTVTVNGQRMEVATGTVNNGKPIPPGSDYVGPYACYGPLDSDNVLIGPLSEEVGEAIYDYSRFVVGKNCLADYLGIPQGTVPIKTPGGSGNIAFNGFYKPYTLQPFLTYLNIWRCYHSNNQETVAPYTKGWFNEEQYDVTSDGVSNLFGSSFLSFDMNSNWTGARVLDTIFKKLRYSDDGLFFAIDPNHPLKSEFDGDSVLNESLNIWLLNAFKPYGGLLPVMYKPDMYRNLLSTDVGKIKRYVSVDPDKGVSIQELRTENAWQRVVDRYDISGGRFSEWARTLWGITTKKGIHIPDLLAVRSTFVGATNIKATATSESSEGSTQLGQLASVIDNRGAFRPLKVRASEPGVLMVCACLIPSVDYSQGLDAVWTRTNFADDYNPELQRLNWEDVPRSRYVALPKKQSLLEHIGSSQVWFTGPEGNAASFSDNVFVLKGVEDDYVIGKQVPWIEKMSAVSKLSGEFGNDGIYQYWAARRKYQRDLIRPQFLYVNQFIDEGVQPYLMYDTESFESFSQYGNPADWQYMFADQSIFKHNFFLQVGISQPRNRKPIGYRYMASLEL